ncbi:hypothetical protein [Maricaulis maris]|uniref:hypothetical protein n=1 Tax=Maricaulis maris TaxID=74318 RepID=UPI003A8F6EB0
MKDRDQVVLKLDIDGAKELVNIGVRRASAFLKLGLQVMDLDRVENLTLPGGVAYNFWPNDIEDATWKQIYAEYECWIKGSCLKELDQYFTLFLNEILIFAELVPMSGAEFTDKDLAGIRTKVAKGTSVSKKVSELSKKIGSDDNATHFSSLTLARNALSHGAGHVRNRDCNCGKSLRVTWLGMEMVIQDGEKEHVFREAPWDRLKIQSPTGAPVIVRYVEQERVFSLGEKVDFSRQELAEICSFFHNEAARKAKAFLEFTNRLGVERVPPPSAS